MDEKDDDYLDNAILSTLQLHKTLPPGDVLVFLTGQEEIDTAVRLLESKIPDDDKDNYRLKICPMYSALPPHLQMQVFERTPPGMRKIIFTTNIAETSVTIPGVKYVIDCGMVKQRGYNGKIGLDALSVVRVSKASARQRTGRAGRECAGVCYRLYTEETFLKAPDVAIPEIQRCNMSSIVLQLKVLGVENVADFDFLDKPASTSLKRAIELLTVLGALHSATKQLTSPIGQQMAALPLEPMYAKLVIESQKFHCTKEILDIVAMLSVDGLFYTPKGKQDMIKQARVKFESAWGDHINLLKIYAGYQTAISQKIRRKKWCFDHFLNIRALERAIEIRRQLEEYCVTLGLSPDLSCKDSIDKDDTEKMTAVSVVEPVIQCLVSAFFIHAAIRQDGNSFKTLVGNKIVQTHPSSSLFGKRPLCVIFDQLVMTKRKYMRGVSVIQPQWLTTLAPSFYARKLPPSASNLPPTDSIMYH
eukprot:TRINITY_DN2116_c0_g1_i1.p1 TRINITY_DN2116_c0_g1~~TRINITY_DN2116_c0_g1_i1.p1  ORF type:complete len:515 (+),score=75.24 TRINITY_DN2116_c0_g1_i1:124-1545(+)